MTVTTVREHLSALQALNDTGSGELADLLRSVTQVNLAVDAVHALIAAGYDASLRLYGGHAMACVRLPEGRVLALDPMGRCHWTSMEECLDEDDEYGVDPEVWDVVVYDADGEMLDFD